MAAVKSCKNAVVVTCDVDHDVSFGYRQSFIRTMRSTDYVVPFISRRRWPVNFTSTPISAFSLPLSTLLRSNAAELS